MPRHEETRLVPYSAREMFDIVSDVERYPEFLPWCAALRVQEREENVNGIVTVVAEMLIAYHGLRERYVSRVTLDAAQNHVEAHHVRGPFSKLDTVWRFAPRAEGCEVYFCIEFSFHSKLLSAVTGLAFDIVARKMADAFLARAQALYGKRSVLV
jgi:coenzyme Q-binding protein COQ10